MGCYAIKCFDDGLAGARYLHTTSSGLYIFDYPAWAGAPPIPSTTTLVRFEYEGDCEAWLMQNIDKPTYDSMTIGDGYTVWLE